MDGAREEEGRKTVDFMTTVYKKVKTRQNKIFKEQISLIEVWSAN